MHIPKHSEHKRTTVLPERPWKKAEGAALTKARRPVCNILHAQPLYILSMVVHSAVHLLIKLILAMRYEQKPWKRRLSWSLYGLKLCVALFLVVFFGVLSCTTASYRFRQIKRIFILFFWTMACTMTSNETFTQPAFRCFIEWANWLNADLIIKHGFLVLMFTPS